MDIIKFSLNSTRLMRTPAIDMDTFYEPVSVRINSWSVGQLQHNFLSGYADHCPVIQTLR